MAQFWFVWNPQGNAPTCRHGSEQSAINEAERLARLNPGQEFVVLEALHVRCVDSMKRVDLRQQPYVDDMPF
jgi:hypothetical protein